MRLEPALDTSLYRKFILLGRFKARLKDREVLLKSLNPALDCDLDCLELILEEGFRSRTGLGVIICKACSSIFIKSLLFKLKFRSDLFLRFSMMLKELFETSFLGLFLTSGVF